MSKNQEIRVPDIGDFKDVDVIEVLVSPGDTVNVEDALITLETDKASMEVPSPAAGVIKEIQVKVGDKVSEGSVIMTVEAADEGGGSAGAAAEAAPAAPAAPPPAAAAGGGTEDVKVPDIGDFKDVDVIEVLVAPGDVISVDDGLITLETDKASMEVPSPAAGVVKELKVKVGDKVSEGSVILSIEAAGSGAAPAAAAPAAAAAEKPAAAAAAPQAPREPPVAAATAVDEVAFSKVHASPSVRRTARELGVDLGKVPGSGRKGRVTKDDVNNYVKGVVAGTPQAAAATAAPAGAMGIEPIPAQDFSKFGEIEVRPLPRIKKISGAHLHRCWLNVPMVTYHDEADSTELEEFRKSLKGESEKRGVRVTGLSFITKALAAALEAFPSFNSSLSVDGESLIVKKYVNVGIAVDTPNGLMVPVIKDANKKGIWQISEDMGTISAKARDGKLKPPDMAGGCMTISSLGGIGGQAFTPLVNAPEVAILGVTRSQMKPIWNGKEFVPRLMLPLDVTFDHRVIDGAEAARFTTYLCQLLSDLKRLTL